MRGGLRRLYSESGIYFTRPSVFSRPDPVKSAASGKSRTADTSGGVSKWVSSSERVTIVPSGSQKVCLSVLIDRF